MSLITMRNQTISLLRVSQAPDAYGEIGQQIAAEVVVKFYRWPERAFGFELRDDENRPARQGMLDLLRDAFDHQWRVNIDYDVVLEDNGDEKKNGVIVRVWLTKPNPWTRALDFLFR